MGEKFEDYVLNNGIEVTKNCKVVVRGESNKYHVSYEDVGGEEHTVVTNNIFFSNPLLEFIDCFNEDIPKE